MTLFDKIQNRLKAKAETTELVYARDKDGKGDAPPFSILDTTLSSRARAPMSPPLAQCDQCSACGHWEDHGPDPWCFYEAYFLGKSAKPVLVKDRRNKCPLEA